MIISQSQKEKTGLENAIDQVLLEMQGFSADDDEYAKMVNQLETLYKLKVVDKPERVSYDTLAIIAGNLVGIVLIIGYERTNVITSKVLSFLLKTR